MNESIKLFTFPKDSSQALAMVYLNTIDLTGKSPEYIVRIYNDAYKRIEAEQEKINNGTDDGSTDKWLNYNQR